MRTGVSPRLNHQIRSFYLLICLYFIYECFEGVPLQWNGIGVVGLEPTSSRFRVLFEDYSGYPADASVLFLHIELHPILLRSIHIFISRIFFLITLITLITNIPYRKRPISTPRLNTLLCVHLVPINLVIFEETTIPHLRAGFPLRCFQRLSIPYIATLRCHGRDSR